MSDALFDATAYARMTPGQKAAYTKRMRAGTPTIKASKVQPAWEREIQTLAEDKLREHGLWADGWRVRWDTATKRAGCCKYREKVISLSRSIFAIEKNRGEALNTILHEIAHALVGPKHAHDWTWKSKALAIGCNGKRCHTMETAPSKRRPTYDATCSCGVSHARFRYQKNAIYRCRKCRDVLHFFRTVNK